MQAMAFDCAHPKACSHLYGWSCCENLRDGQASELQDSAKQKPSFSVVIPTFNQGETIEDTLLSLIHQHYSNLEIIVVDAGSNDNTHAVLDRYRDHLACLISEPDKGQSDAINKGFRNANGDILFWLNSDDYLLPGALQRVAECFLQDPKLDLVVGAGDVISMDHQFLRHITAKPLNEATMLNWKNDEWVMQQCCFWTQRLWQHCGGVDEELHLLMDYDLWFRYSRHTDSATINQKLAVMRYYPNAKTVKQRQKTAEELAYVYAKNGAYRALRDQVSELVAQRSRSDAYLNQINSSLPVRLLKRLSLFPTPAPSGS